MSEFLGSPEVMTVSKNRRDTRSMPPSTSHSGINHNFPAAALLRRLLGIFFTCHHDVEFSSFLHKPTTDMVTLSAQAPFLACSIISLSALYISDDEARNDFGFESAAAVSEYYAQTAITFARKLGDMPSG